MSVRDKHPTVREIMDGDAPFDAPGAHHDPDTGMYVSQDPPPTVTDDDMVKLTSGLFVPKPTSKQVTRLHFDTGLVVDVSESYEEVKDAVLNHKTGDLVFSGPVFADEEVRIRGTHVKRIMMMTVDYRDLAEIELAIKTKEHNLAVARSQLLGSKFPTRVR